MQVRTVETSESQASAPPSSTTRRRTTQPAHSTRRKPSKTPPVEASLQWVTARLPLPLVREIDAQAKRSGTARSDAIRDCLSLGIEAIRGRERVPSGRTEEILAALEGLRATLDIMGPPTLGVLRLLAHWSARNGVKVSEDELLAEVRAVGADEWEQAVLDVARDFAENDKTPLDDEG